MKNSFLVDETVYLKPHNIQSNQLSPKVQGGNDGGNREEKRDHTVQDFDTKGVGNLKQELVGKNAMKGQR